MQMMPKDCAQQAPLTEREIKTLDTILTLPVFDVFKSHELDVLARHMQFLEILRGNHLFTEGDPGNFMGFVVRGLLDVLKKTSIGQDRVVARLGRGDAIGEMSIIDQSPRSAAVVARQTSVVIILTKEAFDHLTENHPAIGVTLLKLIMRLLSGNMRTTTSQLANTLPL